MNFETAVGVMFEKLGNSKIMALASSVDDYPMVRNVSCVFYDQKVYFKTDKAFRKTKQLFTNPKVAMCWNGVQIEGTAKNLGLVIDEPGRRFEALYKQHLWGSYNAYSHLDSEILIEVTPVYVEVWDQDAQEHAFQTFIDFEKQAVEVIYYDK